MLFFFALVLGCASDDSSAESPMIPGLDYYKFTSEDKGKLLNSSLDKGKVIRFRNQSGDELQYKVISKRKERSDDNHGTFSGGGIPSYYYDKQSISLASLDFPDSENSGLSMIVYKPSSSGLMADVYFDRWNEGGYWAKENFALSNVSVQSVSFNGKTYSKTVIVNSQTASTGSGDGFPLNANKMYYDFNYGLIGFDDLDGNLWRRY